MDWNTALKEARRRIIEIRPVVAPKPNNPEGLGLAFAVAKDSMAAFKQQFRKGLVSDIAAPIKGTDEFEQAMKAMGVVPIGHSNDRVRRKWR